MRILTIIGGFSWSVVALENHDDWRGDPCARAGIPWTPFSTHARLNPAVPSRIMARTKHGRHFTTKERVVVTKGDEDVVVVAYHVLLSDESLLNNVKLTQSQNDVALTIDGSDIGSDGQEECVVSVTNIRLPKKLHHLVVDVGASDIEISRVHSQLDMFELLVAAGKISIHDSSLQVGNFVAELAAGSIFIDKGLHAKSQSISTHAGKISGTLIVGQETKVTSNAGSIDMTLIEASNADSSTFPRKVSVSSDAGEVTLHTHIHDVAEIDVNAKAGSVIVSIEPEFEARVHLETSMGRVTYPGEMVVVSDKRSWTGRIVDGFLKRSSGRPIGVLQVSSRFGSVELIVQNRRKDGL